jgi:hypothetical protein
VEEIVKILRLKSSTLSPKYDKARFHKYKCSGATYKGEWLGGFRHGRGTMRWSDGAVYEGEWYLGRSWGKGKFTHTKGEIYEG